MKPEELIKKLNGIKSILMQCKDISFEHYQEYADEIDEAIMALEKQIHYGWHNMLDLIEYPDEMKMIVVKYSDFEDECLVYYKLLIYEDGEFDRIHDDGYEVIKWKYLEL